MTACRAPAGEITIALWQRNAILALPRAGELPGAEGDRLARASSRESDTHNVPYSSRRPSNGKDDFLYSCLTAFGSDRFIIERNRVKPRRES